MPEREGLKVSRETEAKVRRTVDRLREEGFVFDFAETPDTYIITTKDKEGKEKSTHLMKLNGVLPLDNSSYAVEDFIEARLRYPDDDINIAVRKLNQERE